MSIPTIRYSDIIPLLFPEIVCRQPEKASESIQNLLVNTFIEHPEVKMIKLTHTDGRYLEQRRTTAFNPAYWVENPEIVMRSFVPLSLPLSRHNSRSTLSQLLQQSLENHEIKNNPLDQAVSESLPRKKAEELDLKEGCAICQDSYKLDESIVSLPCNHSFHDSCCQEWFKLQSNCPCCRKEIGKSD